MEWWKILITLYVIGIIAFAFRSHCAFREDSHSNKTPIRATLADFFVGFLWLFILIYALITKKKEQQKVKMRQATKTEQELQDNKRLKAGIVLTISKVLAEETGIPEEEINADTKIPLSEAGFATIQRMADAIAYIPGGSNLLYTRKELTVGEVADQCIEQMEKKAEKLGLERRKS